MALHVACRLLPELCLWFKQSGKTLRLSCRGEELGAAVYAAARDDIKLPAPTHFAYQLREFIEQARCY